MKLAHLIGKQALPAETPVWLRLQALFAYMEAESEELVKRAALIKVGEERFTELLSAGNTTMPTKTELDAIQQALVQHTESRAKRHEILPRHKAAILSNMTAEIEAVYEHAHLELLYNLDIWLPDVEHAVDSTVPPSTSQKNRQ